MPASAKRIRVSTDNVTFNTLPGNNGTLTNSGSQVDDTIFGQLYESGFISLINWTIGTNAIIKNVAGYTAKVLKAGTPTSFTDEATTQSSLRYQITDTTKRVLDIDTAVVVKVNAATVTTGYTVDYLFGVVIFASDPGGTVTVSGSYRPMGAVGRAKNISLTQTARAIDESDYDSAQTESGHMTYSAGLKTVALELSGIYDVANAFVAALGAREALMVSIDIEGNGESVVRGFFLPREQSQAGNVGDLETETLQMVLNVPDEEFLDAPISWYFGSSSKVNVGVKNMIIAWLAGDNVYVQYLPNGTAGVQGEAVVTTLSIANAIEGLNEFSVNFQGSGEPATI